jgi:serine/threonine-protein kinase
VSSAPETTVGQIIAGRYELEIELARGGMGTVWEARDQKLGRRVALKVMLERSLDAFPDARERFEREAKVVASLRSAHVVQVHDYGVENGIPFIAMELLEGESLKDRLARSGSMDVAEAAHVVRQAAKGLRAAHRAGLVHRDLKPSNIFIAQRDDEEVVKLLDFGVVKTPVDRGVDRTASGVLLGTPQFMSPEQARGVKEIDHRADLWSLAVILYSMLVGENPFDSEADAVGDIVLRVCMDPIPPPTTIKPELPSKIDAFFERALERSPEERFQSIDELMTAFMACADLSFGGLDERTVDPFASGVHPSLRSSNDSGPQRRDVASQASLDPQTVALPPDPGDEPSSTIARASLALDAQPRRQRIAAVAAIGVVLGAAVVLWATRQGEVTPAAPPPPPPVETAATVAPTVVPPAATAVTSAAPTATATATAVSRPGRPPPAPKTAAPPPPPPPPPPGDDEERPPNWYDDKKGGS